MIASLGSDASQCLDAQYAVQYHGVPRTLGMEVRAGQAILMRPKPGGSRRGTVDDSYACPKRGCGKYVSAAGEQAQVDCPRAAHVRFRRQSDAPHGRTWPRARIALVG
jgi:hypothetical protein